MRGVVALQQNDVTELMSTIIIFVVMMVVNLFVTAAILNKVNDWWGDTPSQMETSLKISGSVILFNLVYGFIQRFLVVAVGSKVVGAVLSLSGIIFALALFIWLIHRMYQTDYLNSLKIGVVSNILAALVIGFIGGAIMLVFGIISFILINPFSNMGIGGI